MAASYGTFGQFGIGTADPVDKRIQYAIEDLVRADELIDGNGIRGDRSSDAEQVRNSIQRVGGPVTLTPTALELSYLLAWIMGGTPSGSPTVTYPLGDTLPTKYVCIDRKVKVCTYAGVGVDKATFRAAKGTNLTLALELVGQTQAVGNTATFPVLSLDKTTKPFIFTDLVLAVAGTTPVSCNSFECVINNMIDKERFFNGLTLSAVNAVDRMVTFSTVIPYGDYSALQAAMTAEGGGMSVTATFTCGGSVLTFTMPAVAIPHRMPGTEGKTEILLPLSGRAYRLSTTKELTITHNPTP